MAETTRLPPPPPLPLPPPLLLLLLLLPLDSTAAPQRPNIVWFLTDDQDQMLGASFPELKPGIGPMPRTRKVLQHKGSTAERFYVHTPICNPSRGELLSGRYFHNIKRPGGALWSMHVYEARVAEESLRDLPKGWLYNRDVW